MVATKHIRSSPRSAHSGAWGAAGTGQHPVIDSLLRQAADLSLRAPELTMILGERAAALAEAAGSDELWVRAESLVVAARVRLGLRAETVGRAVAVLRAAEDLGDAVLAAGLRTDLALCARSVGVPLTGLAALRPVLDVAEFSGAGKAAALCQLVGCLSQFGRKPEVDRALNEADQLCNGDDTLEGDGRLLTRALVRVGVSAHRRRHSDVLGAADAARTGLGLLEQLDDPSCDGGVVRIRLILQLVCSLLDRGDSKNALEIAQPVLDEPVRPASVAPVGWLRMAVATRVLLPAGSVEAAAVMLRDGVHSTERHGLPGLATRLWGELAHVEERLGRPTEAINALRESRAAEHVYTRARRQAVGLLSGEFGNGGHAAVDLDDILGATPQSGAPLAGPAAAAAPAAEVKLAPVRAEASAENRFVVREEPSSGTRETAAEHTAAEHTAAAHKTQHAGSAAAASAGEGVSEASSHAEERDTRSVSRRNGSDAREIKLAPVTVAPPVPPDLPLAPAPADEPSPRISVVSDAVPASSHVNGSGRNGSANGERVLRLGRDTVFAPHAANGVAGSGDETGPADHLSADQAERSGADRVERSGADQAGRPGSGDRAADGVDMAGAATDSAAGRAAVESFDAPGRTAGTERDARSERSRRKTRHDSAHGSVAARSVLDRLGVSAAASGGRRRAAAEPVAGGGAGTAAADETTGAAVADAAATGAAAMEAATTDPEAAAAADVSTADRATADQANAGTANASAANASAANTSAAASGGAAVDVAAGAETAAATSDTAATGTTAIGATVSDTAAANAAAAGTEATASTPDSDAESAGGTNAEASGAGSAQDTGAGNAEAPGAGSAEDSGAGSAESSGAENAEASRAESAENSTSGTSNTEDLPGSSLNENWLPRLRLPPSLEPFEDFGEELPSSTSETHFTSTPVIEDDGLGEPFRAERSHPSTMDDDLPPDAGLADLLARALAEHQAGTSSAAALVKRLENQGAGDPRPVNGHGRNGEVPGNGRHRTDG